MDSKDKPPPENQPVRIPHLENAEIRQLSGTQSFVLNLPAMPEYDAVLREDNEALRKIGRSRGIFSWFTGFVAATLVNIIIATSTTQFASPAIQGAYYAAIPFCIISLLVLGLFWWLAESDAAKRERKIKESRLKSNGG